MILAIRQKKDQIFHVKTLAFKNHRKNNLNKKLIKR